MILIGYRHCRWPYLQWPWHHARVLRDPEARATRSPHGRDRRPSGSRQDKRCAQGNTPMKLPASRIERMLAKVEATLVPPPREWLQVIIDDGDDEAEAKEKALAEHVARHPEDVGRTVEDFNWVLNVMVRPIRLASGMRIMKGSR